MNETQAKQFIYRHARPLDFARWQYLFEQGSRDCVLAILAQYQNPDGGFGHALEADCWNQESSPIQTWAATKIIREVGLTDPHHPLILGLLSYLESTSSFDGHYWARTIPSNQDYPHAEWWDYLPEEQPSYNPTASLIGFILKYAQKGTPLYQTATRLAQEAYADLVQQEPLDSMHTLACYVELYQDVLDLPSSKAYDLASFYSLLERQISQLVCQDVAIWAHAYVMKPSLFISSKQSPFYDRYQALCDLETQFISETQLADGTWPITWQWHHYPEQWAISKNWWKADQVIQNVKFYRAMKATDK